eukprot:1099840-Prorocentrum_minimum.AAC.1
MRSGKRRGLPGSQETGSLMDWSRDLGRRTTTSLIAAATVPPTRAGSSLSSPRNPLPANPSTQNPPTFSPCGKKRAQKTAPSRASTILYACRIRSMVSPYYYAAPSNNWGENRIVRRSNGVLRAERTVPVSGVFSAPANSPGGN